MIRIINFSSTNFGAVHLRLDQIQMMKRNNASIGAIKVIGMLQEIFVESDTYDEVVQLFTSQAITAS